jgi:hypothetical protein
VRCFKGKLSVGMDDNRDDFGEPIEKDEVGAADEEELFLGVDDDELSDDDDEEDLDKFGFHRDDEELTEL